MMSEGLADCEWISGALESAVYQDYEPSLHRRKSVSLPVEPTVTVMKADSRWSFSDLLWACGPDAVVTANNGQFADIPSVSLPSKLNAYARNSKFGVSEIIPASRVLCAMFTHSRCVPFALTTVQKGLVACIEYRRLKVAGGGSWEDFWHHCVNFLSACG